MMYVILLLLIIVVILLIVIMFLLDRHHIETHNNFLELRDMIDDSPYLKMQIMHYETKAKFLKRKLDLCNIYERGSKEYEKDECYLEYLNYMINQLKEKLNKRAL